MYDLFSYKQYIHDIKNCYQKLYKNIVNIDKIIKILWTENLTIIKQNICILISHGMV